MQLRSVSAACPPSLSLPWLQQVGLRQWAALAAWVPTAVAVAVAAIVVTRVIFELRLVVEVPVVWGCINRQGAQREELKAWEHKSGNKER